MIIAIPCTYNNSDEVASHHMSVAIADLNKNIGCYLSILLFSCVAIERNKTYKEG